MKSWFYELEEELYSIINKSPISIDGKYYVLRNVFLNMEKAYKEYLEMPEPESKIANNESDDDQKEDFQIDKTVDENGQFHIEAKGKDIGQVVSEAFSKASE